MITLLSRKRASSLALAVALATGSAVVATAVFPTEASAQRSNRDRDREAAETDGGGYSDAFREAYVPLDEALKTEGTEVGALKPQLLALVPLLNTNDEKIAGGGLIYNAGIRASDQSLQLQGMELMLESGKVPAEQVGRYNFIAYQLSNGAGDFGKARRYLQGAIDSNFRTDSINDSSMRIAMAENFFSANELDAGFDYLRQAIASQKSAGQPVDEQWYRRGLSVAYENNHPAVYEFVTVWIGEYPSAANWRDAINITRNLNTFQDAEMLDLFRLSRRVGALQDATDYDYYVEAADARRLPKEVKDVIDMGRAAGVVTSDNMFLAEAFEMANSRIESDRADLPALERDALAADAGLRTVVAAGDAFLSYGEYAKAAMFYEKSLGMPGVDANEELTRLGIAQAELGDYATARETFGRVTGNRRSIAMLWAAYAKQQEGTAGGNVASAPSETM